MLFFGNNQLAKVSRKRIADFDNQFNLIKQTQSQLYQADIQNSENRVTWTALHGLSDYITITLINDAQYTFNLDLQNAMALWNKNVQESGHIDIVDNLIINHVLEWESSNVNKLTRLVFDDIHDNKIRSQIADLLVQQSALVDAIGTASRVDENYSYSWGQYFAGQMFTFQFLKSRIKLLINKPSLAYTMFSGNEVLYNHQLPFTGKEIAGKQVQQERQMRMQQQQMQQQTQANNMNNPNMGNNSHNDVL